MRELQIIAALDATRVIGYRGAIPWHHPADLHHFREQTMGHVVLMGRGTHESIGRPLPGRDNLVLTRSCSGEPGQPDDRGVFYAPSLTAALEWAYRRDPAPFVIGGAQLYTEALPIATTLHLTYVPGWHQGDRFFPAFDEQKYEKSGEKRISKLTFVTWRRRGVPVLS